MEEKKEPEPIKVIIHVEDDLEGIRSLVKELEKMQKECGCSCTIDAKLFTRF